MRLVWSVNPPSPQLSPSEVRVVRDRVTALIAEHRSTCDTSDLRVREIVVEAGDCHVLRCCGCQRWWVVEARRPETLLTGVVPNRFGQLVAVSLLGRVVDVPPTPPIERNRRSVAEARVVGETKRTWSPSGEAGAAPRCGRSGDSSDMDTTTPPETETTCRWCGRPLTKPHAEAEVQCRTCGWKGK